MTVMLIGFAAILTDTILLFISVQPIMQSVISFLTIKAKPCWCFSLSIAFFLLLTVRSHPGVQWVALSLLSRASTDPV